MVAQPYQWEYLSKGSGGESNKGHLLNGADKYIGVLQLGNGTVGQPPGFG